MNHDAIIKRQTQALNSLNDAIPVLKKDAIDSQALASIIERQMFTPAEDEQIAYWFARYLTIRSNLWDVVNTAIACRSDAVNFSGDNEWQYFVLGYSAVCSLVHLDRFLITKVANDTIIQRKLNEAFPDHRIERKQFSEIYKNLLLPANAVRIHEAHRTLKKKQLRIVDAVSGSPVESILAKLPQQERYIDLSWRNYIWAWLSSRKLVWRRRGASARQQSLFAVLEYSGRFVSELSLPRAKKVTPSVRGEVEQLLRPGDVFVTRHNRALTNLFLPGFWPHAALYVGLDNMREKLGINAESQYLTHWQGNNSTFEALKDGVHFRPLEDTLSVDAFVVLRPNFSEQQIAEALSRVVNHAGKGYNFDFDFFRSDQLVCTEVVYRAYDGIGNIAIPLQERMGRKTLSAEDLLDLCLDSDWGEVIAIYGVGESKKNIVTGGAVEQILRRSYRKAM